MSSSRVLALATAAICCACQSAPPVRLDTSGGAPAPDAYEEVLAEHLRRSHVYTLLEDRADVRAAYHSPRLKQAFLAARERFHGRAAEKIDRLMRGLPEPKDQLTEISDAVTSFTDSTPVVQDLTKAETFFLAFYAADQEHRSLEHDNSIWDVTLTVDGGEPMRPLRMERIRRTPSLDQVYPFLGKLDVAYILYFPSGAGGGSPTISKDARSFTLRVVSKLADAQLTWDVAR